MLERIKQLFRKQKLGLLELPTDDRDFNFGIFGFGYKPKSTRVEIKTLGIRNQRNNTCSFNSRTSAKEVDEKVPLSVRFLVKMGIRLGLISGDGFANLRASEQIVQQYGICRASVLPEDSYNLSWYDYSNPTISKEAQEDATHHRCETYWRIYNKEQAYQALDDGHTIRIGVAWRSSMNTSQMQFPFILDFTKGSIVGGHAILVVGYDINYQGQSVFICQNSFGAGYGDNGKMYILEADFEREIARYGAYTDKDVPIDMAKWLNANHGKLFQELGGNKIYKIEGDRKRHFPDMATMIAHGYNDQDVYQDQELMLPEIKEGDEMDFWQGQSVKAVKEVLERVKDNKVVEEFKKYFSEILT